MDAQAIAQIIAYERDYCSIKPAFSHEKREYSELRAVIRRYYQVKKMYSQESLRLTGIADMICPEIAATLGTGMTYLKVLAVFPSSYDIMHCEKEELIYLIQSASKNRFKADKAEKLLEACKDSLN